MSRYFIKRSKNQGKAPGSLVFIGEQKSDQTNFKLFTYNENSLEEKSFDKLTSQNLFNIDLSHNVNWLDIDALHDLDLMKSIKESYKLHHLMMEDVLNTGQRPKKEDFVDMSLISMKMLQFSESEIQVEQVSFVLKNNFLISFQEHPGDLFDMVRYRIRNSKGKIRSLGADYLCYALMDTIVDQYFDIIGKIGDEVEDLEDQILHKQSEEISSKIYQYKREFRLLHKAILPVRDILLKILREEDLYFKKETKQYIRDLLDLTQQALDSVETYREQLSDYHNTYNTLVNNRMNDVMKVLTIFASIFIPLTFIAGVYGTNFDYIPELSFKYSYFIMWGVFIILIIGMLIYFKRKKWL